MSNQSTFEELFFNAGDNLWSFLELKDILNLSVCSTRAGAIRVPVEALNKIVSQQRLTKEAIETGKLGHLNLSFPDELSTGMLRRVMNRLCGSNTAIVTIDERNGRITLDLGSAFHDNDNFFSSEENMMTEEFEGESQQIFKQLEISSYDEYDDFNPRHPVPKERSNHRRGDSYFNSDVETLVNELSSSNNSVSSGGDLSSLAKAALLGGNNIPTGANSNSNNNATTGGGEDASSRKATTSSLKDRLLAKSKNSASRPPIPTGRSHLTSPIREEE